MTASAGAKRRPRTRPAGAIGLALETLEDRTVPAIRFVVPTAAAIDNVTTFHTVSKALTTSGLLAGDTIQIEAGADPGRIRNSDLPNLTGITIQGNLNAAATDFRPLVLQDAITIGSTRDNLTFRNLQTLNVGGTMTLNATLNLDRVHFDNVFNGNAIVVNGVGPDSVQFVDSFLTNNNPTIGVGGTNALVTVNAATGSANLFRGNTIRTNVVQNSVKYVASGTPVITDRFLNNTFIDSADAGGGTAPFNVSDDVNGLQLIGNRFTDPDSSTAAIGLKGTNLLVERNVFDYPLIPSVGGPACITISSGAGLTTSGVFRNNVFYTAGFGVGLSINPSSTATVSLRIEGNDFNGNKIGVLLNGNGTSLNGVDLGGGATGSLGGNNFRTFTAAATGNSGAILVQAVGTAVVQAQKNLFSSVGPATVIRDQADLASLSLVNAANPLTGNAAFVQALYTRFLKRTGDTNNPNDAGFHVNLLNGGAAPLSIVNSIVRSPESYGLIVDDLYATFLGRNPVTAERNFWIAEFQAGKTLETARSQFAASPEYGLKFPTATAFVTNQYVNLIRRIPTSSELTAGVNTVNTSGRFAFSAGFQTGSVVRTFVVIDLYRNMLHRTAPPTQAEVDFWVNGPLDLLSIQINLAATTEFQDNG
jgi:hypothetical protein